MNTGDSVSLVVSVWSVVSVFISIFVFRSSIMDAVMAVLEEKPWLWAVLVISLLLPIAIGVYCCSGSDNKVCNSFSYSYP